MKMKQNIHSGVWEPIISSNELCRSPHHPLPPEILSQA